MMGQLDLEVTSADGEVLLNTTVPQAVGDVIVRSILLGRSQFATPVSEEVSEEVLKRATPWLDRVRKKLQDLLSESTAGSGYEQAVETHVFQYLGVHPSAFEKQIPRDISFTKSE
jgi:hypothetical protein